MSRSAIFFTSFVVVLATTVFAIAMPSGSGASFGSMPNSGGGQSSFGGGGGGGGGSSGAGLSSMSGGSGGGSGGGSFGGGGGGGSFGGGGGGGSFGGSGGGGSVGGGGGSGGGGSFGGSGGGGSFGGGGGGGSFGGSGGGGSFGGGGGGGGGGGPDLGNCPPDYACMPSSNGQTDAGCSTGHTCQSLMVSGGGQFGPGAGGPGDFGSASPNGGGLSGPSPYAYRYTPYTVSTLTGVHSKIPLLYSETYRSWQAVRFLATDSATVVLTVTITLRTRPVTSTSSSSNTNVSFAVGISKTVNTADWDAVISMAQRMWADSAKTFVNPSDRTTRDVPKHATNFTCGNLMALDPVTYTVRANAWEDGVVSLSPLTSTASSSSSSANAYNYGACPAMSLDGAPRFSGMAYSTQPFTRSALLTYAYLESVPAATSEAAMANTNATDRINVFRTGSGEQHWKGPASTAFYFAFGARVNLVGDTTDTSFGAQYAVSSEFLYALYPKAATSTVALSATTALVATCTAGDATAYDAAYVAQNTNISKGLKYSCYQYDTVDDIHQACAADSGCTGFTTVRMIGPVELPLCLYRAGAGGPLDVLEYPRMFYTKPATAASTPVCSVPLHLAGRIAVFVQQTSLASRSVVLRINGRVAAVCGEDRPFANGYTGADGRCDVLALCYVGNVGAFSTLEVLTPKPMLQRGCSNSLGVLVRQLSVDAVQVNATVEAPVERVDTAEYQQRHVESSLTLSLEAPERIFVHGAERALLEVDQSGFSCALYSEQHANATCPAYVVELSTGQACQRCGGAAGFYRNGRAGLSDACDTGMFCGEAMTLQTAPGAASSATTCSARGLVTQRGEYSGVVSIGARGDTLTFESDTCGSFTATLYAARKNTSTLRAPLFPLVGTTDGAFNTLLAVPPSANISKILGVSDSRRLQGVEWLLATGPPQAPPLNAFYVPWDEVYMDGNPQASLAPNMTQVCIVDHHLGLGATCSFYIPRNATKVRVSAAQTDFAANAMTVSFTVDSGQTAATGSVTCGGSSSARFGKALGAQEQCNVFETCTDQYIFADDAVAVNTTTAVVTVSLPAAMRPRSCNYTAVIIAEFSRPQTVAAACPEYECAGERKCIPYAKLCDQIQDCASNADESLCFQWSPLASESLCVGQNYTTNYTRKTFDACRRIAVANATAAFSHSLASGNCTIYSSSFMSTVLGSPASYVCPTPQATTYLALNGNLDSLRVCRASVHCSGNGVLTNASLGAAPPCVCQCAAGFSGSACDQRLSMDTITHLVVGIAVKNVKEGSADVRRAVIAAALALSVTDVTLSCTHVVPHNATVIAVTCALSGTATRVQAHARWVLSTAGQKSLRDELKKREHPVPAFVSSRTAMNPIERINDCTAAGVCPVHKAFERALVTVRSNVSVVGMTVSVDYATSTGTSAAQRRHRRSIACSPASTDVGGGCIANMCDIGDISAGNSGATISVSSVVLGNATPLTTTCPSSGVDASTQLAFGNLATTTNTTVQNIEKDFTSFLIGGICVFVVGAFVCAVTALVFYTRYRRIMRELSAAVDTTGMTAVEKDKATMLVNLHYQKAMEAEGKRRPDLVAIVFFIASLLCGIGASFLTIYYKTAYDVNSNFSVMYEEYSDYLCEQSPTSYMPRRLFAMPAGSIDCEKMQAIGEAAGASYAVGRCEGRGGQYIVHTRVGSSRGSCESRSEMNIPSGHCAHISTIDPSATRNVYVRLTCSDSGLIAQRGNALEKLTQANDIFVDGMALEADDNIRLDKAVKATGTGITRQGYLEGSVRLTSSSHDAATVEAVATTSDLSGAENPLRVVLQSSNCTFITDETTARACLSADEARITSISSVPAAQRAMGPSTKDLSVGNIYSGFGTSSPLAWSSAGANAHRYYGVQDTEWDMRAHFPRDPKDLTDGEGYAISMYLRADSKTQGFAYAVVDAFENAGTGVIYALDRLAKIIDNGQGGSAWFAGGASVKVYHSLYVNGPGRILTFAYVDPALPRVVYLLDFDLETIAMTHALNGLWHHVAVSFIVENGRARAQLVIDGMTSYVKSGWSVCVETFPTAVSPVKAGDRVSLYSVVTDVYRAGGVLVTGYFSGGIYGLKATPTEVLNTAFLAQGTPAMRARNPFPRQNTLTLGAILAAVAIFLFLGVIGMAVIDIRSMRNLSSAKEARATAQNFYTLLKAAIDQDTDDLFGANEDGATAADKDDSDGAGGRGGFLRPLTFVAALRWTDMTVADFASVLEEITTQARNPAQRLVLLLMEAKTGRKRLRSFAAAEWNTLVTSDAAQHESGRVCFCFPRTPDHEAELALQAGADTFARVFGLPLAVVAAAEISLDGIDAANGQDWRMAAVEHPTSSSKKYTQQYNSAAMEQQISTADVDEMAGDDGVQAAAELRGQNVGIGGGQTDMKTPLADASSALSKVVDTLAPVIAVFQSMYVWATSIKLPSLYDDYFRGFFSFISVDFATAFQDVPTLVTPLLQLFVGLVAFALVVYFMISDNARFERVLSRYVWRRDALEGDDDVKAHAAKCPPQYMEALADDNHPEPMIPVETMPVDQCRRLDIFAGKIPNVFEDEDVTDYTQPTVEVHTFGGERVAIGRSKTQALHLVPDAVGASTTSHDPAITKNNLEIVGHRCRRHPDTRLSPQTQNDVWPFNNPPVCCLVVNGSVCGEQCGVIFSCGREYNDPVSGERRVCNYALCQRHCRMTVRQQLFSRLAGFRRQIENNGAPWLLCVGVVLAANAAYTPFVKTALMILGCHPFYQCEFKSCWSNMDQKYALAVFLSLVVIVCFGIGLPAGMFLALWWRRRRMQRMFLSPQYNGRYSSGGPPTSSPSAVNPDESHPQEGNKGAKSGTSVTQGKGEHAIMMDLAATNALTMKGTTEGITDADEEATAMKHSSVSEAEWARFAATDASGLAQQYQQVYFQWMFFPALLILFKVIGLLPAIFLEPRSFDQRLGIAVVELAIAAFVFVTRTQLSPVLLMTIRAASIHQVTILALQNFALVAENDDSAATAYLPALMVGATLLYVFFSACVLFITAAWPVFAAKLDERRLRLFLNRHGLDYSRGISLFLNPLSHGLNTCSSGNTDKMAQSLEIDTNHNSVSPPRSPQHKPSVNKLFVTSGETPTAKTTVDLAAGALAEAPVPVVETVVVVERSVPNTQLYSPRGDEDVFHHSQQELQPHSKIDATDDSVPQNDECPDQTASGANPHVVFPQSETEGESFDV